LVQVRCGSICDDYGEECGEYDYVDDDDFENNAWPLIDVGTDIEIDESFFVPKVEDCNRVIQTHKMITGVIDSSKEAWVKFSNSEIMEWKFTYWSEASFKQIETTLKQTYPSFNIGIESNGWKSRWYTITIEPKKIYFLEKNEVGVLFDCIDMHFYGLWTRFLYPG
jgi:hypothetical protein